MLQTEKKHQQKLTKIGFIGTALQADTFGVRLNQEVPHQLVSHVTN